MQKIVYGVSHTQKIHSSQSEAQNNPVISSWKKLYFRTEYVPTFGGIFMTFSLKELFGNFPIISSQVEIKRDNRIVSILISLGKPMKNNNHRNQIDIF